MRKKCHNTRNVTQKDVAREAKVSQPVVSMVVNNDPRVNPATRRKVERVIRDLGYVPNLMARGLVGGKTNTVSLVTESLKDESNFFGRLAVLEGLDEGLRGKHYVLNVFYVDPEETSRETVFRIVRQHNFDGMFVLLPPTEEPGYIEFLADESIPFVLVNHFYDDPQVPSVSFVNSEVGHKATEFLIRKGHRRIAYIGGPEKETANIERLRGYRQALDENGITFDPTLVFHGNFQVDGGYHAMKALIERNENSTAVFSGNDSQALGVYHALYEMGKVPGRDMAVLGCDDQEMSKSLMPPLTTVAVPFYKMGQTAAWLLTQILSGEDVPSRQIILPSMIVERESA